MLPFLYHDSDKQYTVYSSKKKLVKFISKKIIKKYQLEKFVSFQVQFLKTQYAKESYCNNVSKDFDIQQRHPIVQEALVIYEQLFVENVRKSISVMNEADSIVKMLETFEEEMSVR